MSDFNQPAGGMWEEDANSPFTFSGASSATANLADTGYDRYLVTFTLEGGNSTTNNPWGLQFAGYTSGYYYEGDGSRTTSASEVLITESVPPANRVMGRIEFAGEFNTHCMIAVTTKDATGSPTESAYNTPSELTSVSLYHLTSDATVSGVVQVFHRDEA